MTPLPGDFAVVSAAGLVGPAIDLAERLAGKDAYSAYQHAFVYIGKGMIVQAEPNGAEMVPARHYALTLWSTGLIPMTLTQRVAVAVAAKKYRGTPYSFLDYAALAAHRFRLPLPWLRSYVASTGHLICSQLVDQCYQDAGVQLFADGRWPGYVTPADLARLLISRKVN